MNRILTGIILESLLFEYAPDVEVLWKGEAPKSLLEKQKAEIERCGWEDRTGAGGAETCEGSEWPIGFMAAHNGVHTQEDRVGGL